MLHLLRHLRHIQCPLSASFLHWHSRQCLHRQRHGRNLFRFSVAYYFVRTDQRQYPVQVDPYFAAQTTAQASSAQRQELLPEDLHSEKEHSLLMKNAFLDPRIPFPGMQDIPSNGNVDMISRQHFEGGQHTSRTRAEKVYQ